MTLRVCIINENGLIHLARARRYTISDTDQTPVLHERYEPAKECDVRNREVVSIVAPTRGARRGDSPSLRFRIGVRERLHS